MGLFAKRKAPTATPRPQPGASEAPGWEAIDAAFAKVYGSQEPRHVAPPVPPAFSGKGDAWGISAYDAGDHWHFVTYALSELFAKETADPAVSGRGYELTLRLLKQGDAMPMWAFSELNYLVQMINTGQIDLWVGDRLDRQAPLSDLNDTLAPTLLQVWFVVTDPQMGRIDTPHGQVEFRQLVGMTPAESDAAKASSNDTVLNAVANGNPLLITKPARASTV